MVSLKVKYTISSRMRTITKKYTVGGPGLELVQITLFEDEALAPKYPKITHLGWPSKPQLIRSLLHESPQEYVI
jgi:hypothetical protein